VKIEADDFDDFANWRPVADDSLAAVQVTETLLDCAENGEDDGEDDKNGVVTVVGGFRNGYNAGNCAGDSLELSAADGDAVDAPQNWHYQNRL